MSSQVLPPTTQGYTKAHLPHQEAHATIASSLSSRPRRAAAIASRDAIQASTRPEKRRKSQSSASSAKSSGSTASSSTSGVPKTPQSANAVAQDLDARETYKNQRDAQKGQGVVAALRPMAALPRSKRARRNEPAEAAASFGYHHVDAPQHVFATRGMAVTDNGMGNGHAHYNNGNAHGTNNHGVVGHSSKASIVSGIESALNGQHAHTQQSHVDKHRLPAASVASSSKSRGSATANSIREMIGGQERDVYVVDSTSPAPRAVYGVQGENHSRASSIGAKGKRKAPESPMQSAASSTYGYGTPGDQTLTAPSKRRRKDPFAQVQQQQSHAQAQAPGASYGSNHALYSGPGDPGTQPSLGNYRGGYPTGNAYYKQTSTLGRTGMRSQMGTPSYPVIPPPQQPIDDGDGHYIVREGAYVTEKYQIESLLGQGTFGKVVKCRETRSPGKVAVKIIRAVQKYTDAAQIEIRVLQTLRKADPNNEFKCIHLIETFTYLNHVCMVSELLGQSVFDFLKDNKFAPFPPRHIWSFAQQLLRSVAFLHKLHLVHTDLKPENILLVEDGYDSVPTSNRYNAKRRNVLRNTEIRLIDFGSATFNDEYHSQIVSTRHYRAPEIILQMGWSFPCDVWSIGCILVEFYTGEALFQTHENVEHMAMMEAVLGHMPDDFRKKAETYRPGFFRAGYLDFPNRQTPKASREFVRKMQPLELLTRKSAPEYRKHDQRFVHLLKHLLHFDPSKRIRVDQALLHPYFELKEEEIPPM